MAVIDEIIESNLIDESYRKGLILHKGLNEIKDNSNGLISDVLGKGMIASILFQDPQKRIPESKVPSEISEKCMQSGLLVVHTGRESIKIGPPLNISDEALLEGISIINIIASKMLSKSLFSSKNLLSWHQKRPKSFPRLPKRLRRQSQDTPKTPQEAPKTPLRRVKNLARAC